MKMENGKLLQIMKKNFWMLLSSVIFVFCASAQAQVVSEGELAMVYYMPQTQIVVDITYSEVHEQAGPFVLFAEQYMGAEDAIEEDALHYEIEQVHIMRQTRPDYNRAYKIVAENGVEMQLLQLNKDGILAGYNLEVTNDHQKGKNENHKDKSEMAKKDELTTLPYLEEQMNAKTLEEMAASVAKQIFRIRENRMYLLGGEIDHAPADGKAMKLVLDELDKQERVLVEQFIGKRTTKTMHKKIVYTPTKSESVQILRFSESAGIVAADDESGRPITMQINARKQVQGAGHGTVDKKAPQPSQLYYNLPGSAEICVMDGEQVLDEYTMPVAQFGIAIPLAKSLFTGKDPVHIEFDTKTGNVKSITK